MTTIAVTLYLVAAVVEILGVTLVVLGIRAERSAISRFVARPVERPARRTVSKTSTLAWRIEGRELNLEEKMIRLEGRVESLSSEMHRRLSDLEQESRAYTELHVDALREAQHSERESLDEFVRREVRWLRLDLKWWGAGVLFVGVLLGTVANVVAVLG